MTRSRMQEQTDLRSQCRRPDSGIVAIPPLRQNDGYFGGKTFGGSKIAPSASPKKTWSGAIAGWACAALVGFAFASFLGRQRMGRSYRFRGVAARRSGGMLVEQAGEYEGLLAIDSKPLRRAGQVRRFGGGKRGDSRSSIARLASTSFRMDPSNEQEIETSFAKFRNAVRRGVYVERRSYPISSEFEH